MNESERALKWLERGHGERADMMTYLKMDSRLDGLRNEARFTHLLRRVVLAQ